jgi:hypothetical protein
MIDRILVLVAFCIAFTGLVMGPSVRPAYSQEKCAPVDPASMVWTGHGFSIAMGDGHLWINREDVVYAEVSQPHVCMPAKGMMQLWLPHAWPSYASDGTRNPLRERARPPVLPRGIVPYSGSSRFSARALTTGWPRLINSRVSIHTADAPSIILAHQKLASDAWIDRSKNKKGERCCDAGKDCHSIEPERVKPAEGGVVVQLDDRSVFVPGDQIMVSEDGKYWVCYWGGQIKCFFAPHSGS